MRLALAQINPTVGDLDHNAAIIARAINEARERRCDLVVFPELSLCGYPPKDLLLQEGFIRAASRAAKSIGEGHTRGITAFFGVPLPLGEEAGDRRIVNSLVAYRDGKLAAFYDKRLLPTYDVFDESRYFTPGTKPVIFDAPTEQGPVRVGLSICEDLWKGQDVGLADRYAGQPDPVAQLLQPPDGSLPAELIVNPSASPFVLGKGRRHRDILKHHAQQHGVFVAGVNQVGGNDELIFDGHAAVFDPDGDLVAAAPGFVEHLLVVDLPREEKKVQIPGAGLVARIVGKGRKKPGAPGVIVGPRSTALPNLPDPLALAADEELVYRALVLVVRDYCRKTGFASVVLGLSGGIDSAVTAVLCAAAVGPRRTLGVLMPGPYSSPGSVTDARALAEALGSPWHQVPIGGAYDALAAALAPAFAGRGPDVTEENLQSRVRGTILMALSNKFGHLLVTTGNKSELAVGYCTLYGDMNGGLAVLSDLDKMLVYRLAEWMNANWGSLGIEGLAGPPIPRASITKPPSAELRANQTDQDTLPPYPVLDAIIERYVEQRQSPATIASAMAAQDAEVRADAATVARIVRMIDVAEYKRKQSPVGLKVTSVAFGSGRRMPIAQGYRPERNLTGS